MRPEVNVGEAEYLNMLIEEFIGSENLSKLAIEEIARDGDSEEVALAQEEGAWETEEQIAREIWLNPRHNQYLELEEHPSFEDWVFATNLETFTHAIDQSGGQGDFLRAFA